MIPFKIKICGVTTPDDANCVCRSGADAIGLNFFDPSPRFVDLSAANMIIEVVELHNEQVKQSGGGEPEIQGQIDEICLVKKVGVFVNSDVAKIVTTAKILRLDAIQLHGDEDPEIVSAIRGSLEKEADHCLLIRALRTSPASQNSSSLPNETSRVADEIKKWTDAGIDAILLDAAMPGEFGGTGKVVDWNSISDLNCQVPLVLAGGLNPDNVRRGISVSGAQSVDVASGVESKPGEKDHDKIQAFVDEAKCEFDLRI